MWLFLILYSLLSQSFLFSINPPNDLLYSKKGDIKRKVIYMKNSEAASWGAIKAIFKDDNNNSSDSKNKRDKGK